MRNLTFLILTLLPSALAGSQPFKGRVNEIAQPLGVSDAHPFVKRYCEGAPYSNTYCCGSLYYCFTGEVCCSSFYCCPGGTTCLGGLMCSNGGDFTETGSPITSAAPPVTSIAPPPVTSFFATEYLTYYYTITWYYYTYYYTYDYILTTTVLESYRRTTWQYFTITATDETAASSSFDAISETISFSVPASETAPTPISIPSVSSVPRTTRPTTTTTSRSVALASLSPSGVATGSGASIPSFGASGGERVGGNVWIAGWRMVAGFVVALGLPGVLMVAL